MLNKVSLLHIKNSGPAQWLRSGDFINLKVIKHIEADTWLISLRGSLLKARSSNSLDTGQIVRGRAVWNRNILNVQIIEDADINHILTKELGLSKSTHNREILKSLMRFQLAVHEKFFPGRELTRFEHLKKSELYSLYVMLKQKGIVDPEHVIGLMFGQSDSRKKKEQQNTNEGSRKDSGTEENMQTDDISELYTLINCTGSGDSQWKLLPWQADIPGGSINGQVRMLYVNNRISRLIYMIDDAARYYFVVEQPESDGAKALFIHDGNLENSFAETLIRKLKPVFASYKINDYEYKVLEEFDGFNPDIDISMPGVDVYA